MSLGSDSHDFSDVSGGWWWWVYGGWGRQEMTRSLGGHWSLLAGQRKIKPEIDNTLGTQHTITL